MWDGGGGLWGVVTQETKKGSKAHGVLPSDGLPSDGLPRDGLPSDVLPDATRHTSHVTHT